MKVIVAEDDVVSSRMLTRSLSKWGYEVEAYADGALAYEALVRPDSARLAILDWEMPGLWGIEICRKVRAIPELPFRHLILLTARESEADIVAALEAGANDYITKPWNSGELRARLGVGERMLLLHEQLEEQHRRLLQVSQTDFLTGLKNRPWLMERIEVEYARAKRTHEPFSVLMIDIDHFKRINDTHGHTAGDHVLVEVAKRIQEGVRTYDVMGRYGGEEFLGYAVGLTYEGTAALAERLRASVADSPIEAQDCSLSVTISVGAIWTMPDDLNEIAPLIELADAQLYEAKEAGRNRVALCRGTTG